MTGVLRSWPTAASMRIPLEPKRRPEAILWLKATAVLRDRQGHLGRAPGEAVPEEGRGQADGSAGECDSRVRRRAAGSVSGTTGATSTVVPAKQRRRLAPRWREGPARLRACLGRRHLDPLSLSPGLRLAVERLHFSYGAARATRLATRRSLASPCRARWHPCRAYCSWLGHSPARRGAFGPSRHMRRGPGGLSR